MTECTFLIVNLCLILLLFVSVIKAVLIATSGRLDIKWITVPTFAMFAIILFNAYTVTKGPLQACNKKSDKVVACLK